MSVPAPVLFKDFSKSSKDLLTKNYQQNWKIESKLKPADKTITFNPIADEKGVVVNVEYAHKAHGLKTKVAVSSDLTVVPTLTYEKNGHKVEAKVAHDFELTYEGALAGAGLYAKGTKKSIVDGVSYAVSNDLTVGAFTEFDLASKAVKDWAIAVKYTVPVKAAPTVTVLTNFKKFDVTAISALPIMVNGKKIQAALTVGTNLASKAPGAFKVEAGVESKCILCPVAVVKAKINDKLEAAISYIIDAGAWKTAISCDVSKKPTFGVLITRE